MGFKRTTEGRVFFQNIEGESLNSVVKKPLTAPSVESNEPGATPAREKAPSGASQTQIIALLQSLNTKLQSTQVDREKLQSELETYKTMVLALQEKTRDFEFETKRLKQQVEKTSQSAQKDEKLEELNRETMKEFEETRRLIAEIEERSERTEAMLKKQQAKVRQTEEQNSIKWESFEQNQKKQAQEIYSRLGKSEDSQKLLSSKVDQSLSAAEKIDRKIEKAMQDRTRLIRKLERIEETVLQTHEALNARAMVLLTDQHTATNSVYPSAPALGNTDEQFAQMQAAQNITADNEFLPWWKKSMPMRATSVSMIVIAALLGGWLLSSSQKPDGIDFSALMNTEQAASGKADRSEILAQNSTGQEIAQTGDMSQASAWANAGNDRTVDADLTEPMVNDYAQNMPGADAPNIDSQVILSQEDAAAFDDVINNQSSEFAETQLPQVTADSNIGQDYQAIDLTNEEELLAALENDPDALAARLNAIEPTSLMPEEENLTMAAENAVSGNIPPATQSNPIATPKEINALRAELRAVNLPSTLDGPLQARIQPDSGLPAKVKEIEKSAFEGNPEAQHDLAAIYVAGHGGVKQNFDRAALWFEEAAHNGIANARYNLGVLNHQGIGVEKNVPVAFEWYKTAAALGHPEAQYNLGIAYIEGVGVPYNPQRAGIFFENAAKGGVMEAAYNLGLIYENGLLGTVQPDSALMWYKRAADQGSPEAKAALEQLAKTLGMSISDVNKLIDGMEVLNTASAQKKTDKPARLEKQSAVKTPEVSEKPKIAAASKPSETDLRQTLIAQVQEQLMEIGLYPGPVDGVSGMITTDAVRSYQSRNQLSVDGQITAQLLEHMKMSGFGTLEEYEEGSSEY